MKKISFNLLLFCFFVSPLTCFGFTVYDATLYNSKPDTIGYNIKKMPVIYEFSFFGNDKSKYIVPDSLRMSNVIDKVIQSRSDMVVLDIERWGLKGSKELIRNSVDGYVKVIKDIRRSGVKKLMGYYGRPPIRDYWRAVSNENSLGYLDWQKENDNIKEIADQVDVLFPSLYTFYNNRNAWKKYAIAQISEARRLGPNKPVIVFLWPQYHNSNVFLRGKYLPREYWRLQLDTARQYADGLVIWGGWKQNWDPTAPWWLETIKFVKDNNLD